MSRWMPASVAVAGVVLAGAGHLHLQAIRLPGVMGSAALAPRPSQTQTPVPSAAAAAVPSRALLDQYCVTCHNQKLKTAGLMLDKADVRQVGAGADVWEKVIRKLRANAMPPSGRPRPDAATSRAFVSWLETELDRAALATPNPGRPAVHRLNRVEYANAIRDLFGLDVDAHALLPADDEQHGFDNIADILTVSPTLIERYMVAAQRISQLAVGDPGLRPTGHSYPVNGWLDQDERTSDDLPFGSRGGVAIQHNFPGDGEYIVRLRLRKQQYGYVRGLGQPHLLDVRVDGARIGTLTVGRVWGRAQRPPLGFAGEFEQIYNSETFPEWEAYSLHADEGLEVRASVKGGPHLVGVSFDRRPALPEGILPLPTDRSTTSYGKDELQNGNPAISSVDIIGPFNGRLTEDLPSRRKIFICRPAGGPGDEERCAGRILSTLARRAYRRPTTQADIDTLMAFYRDGRSGGSFDTGIQAAVERILVGPQFLFRVESDPPGVRSGAAYRISDLELASRLSFFLWSSIPDDELLDLAVRRKLSDPAVLDQQVRRMLADARSRALIENFAVQWLQLRSLRNLVPDTATYIAFDENLRDAMQQETELFLENELRDDRPVVNVLRANYTFVNERLARHYGIPGVYGVHFRRVPYPDGTRGGLLSHASILTVTSYATRTSPVVRGKWLLENVLGTPPSPPPPNVPSLPDARQDGSAPTSVRERLEQHRRNPVCAGCHNVIDPLGFTLEHYDAIGRWRTTNEGGTPFDTGTPIDDSGTLIDGTKLQGLQGLRNVVLSREGQFVETVAEKLLMYALGRTLESHDMPVVRQISRQSAAGDLKWSSLILAITRSTPFLMRRSES
jgi:cytochrome c5